MLNGRHSHIKCTQETEFKFESKGNHYKRKNMTKSVIFLSPNSDLL